MVYFNHSQIGFHPYRDHESHKESPLMFYVLISLAALAMLYVVGTLIIGGTRMAKTGNQARVQSNSWMWKRVGAQALAIGLLYLAFKVR